MAIFRAIQQRAAFPQKLDDRFVRFEYAQAFVFRQSLDESPVIIERRIRIEPVALSRIKVVRAMPRRRMHHAAALIERHVLSQHSRHGSSRNGCRNCIPSRSFPFPRQRTFAASNFNSAATAFNRSDAKSSAPTGVSATTYSKFG